LANLLRRYTNVLSLLGILHHGRLTLLSPSQWYDQNDALGLRQYSKLRGRGSVYALCLAEGYEQAHHWQIFAGHAHGLCIQFDKDEFLSHLDAFVHRADILHGPVQYKNLSQLRALAPVALNDLPFLKRDTFRAEEEYRVVAWEDEILALDAYTIPMPAGLIRKVTLGPAMPDKLAETLHEITQTLDGCSEIAFAKSRLVNNASWAKALAEAIGSS
jgi:hypothetical protein